MFDFEKLQINKLNLTPINLVGTRVRTSNKAEINPQTAQISTTMQTFFGIKDRIINRINSNKVLAVYTNYDSNEHGHYDYFIGQEVINFDDVSQNFQTLIIPAQMYTKFTSSPGAMPNVVINTWQKIWQMTSLEIGGQRAFSADFEVYDERSRDASQAVVDIFIGIQ